MKRFAAGAALAAAFIVSTALQAAPAKEPPPSKGLEAFFEREFVRGLEEHPENATFLGIPGYDDKVSDFSPDRKSVV